MDLILALASFLHRVARTNEERRIVINSIGAVWEGNQIWLILGAGAIFAAWPDLYAVAFSGFYFAMLLVLLALILRPVGFKYRSKIENTHWRAVGICAYLSVDLCQHLFLVSQLAMFYKGVPFYLDDTLLSHYTGTCFNY